jgi:rubrerythrin
VYSIKGGMDAWNGLKATGEYEAGMYLIEGRKTMEEFLSLAWSLEDGTGTFYEAVMNTIEGNELKSVFHSLVKAEETHKTALLDTYRRVKGETVKSEALAERSLSGLMESGVSVEEAVVWAKQRDRDPRDILEFSMQLETNSLDLYMKVLRGAEDEGVRETFRSLIDEEKRHLARLGNLLNSMYNV